MYSSLHLRLCLYVFGQILGSLCMCTYKCTRHTLRGSECWGKFSCLYLLSPRGMAGVTDIFTVYPTLRWVPGIGLRWSDLHSMHIYLLNLNWGVCISSTDP